MPGGYHLGAETVEEAGLPQEIRSVLENIGWHRIHQMTFPGGERGGLLVVPLVPLEQNIDYPPVSSTYGEINRSWYLEQPDMYKWAFVEERAGNQLYLLIHRWDEASRRWEQIMAARWRRYPKRRQHLHSLHGEVQRVYYSLDPELPVVVASEMNREGQWWVLYWEMHEGHICHSMTYELLGPQRDGGGRNE
jgi:hypothetical protein